MNFNYRVIKNDNASLVGGFETTTFLNGYSHLLVSKAGVALTSHTDLKTTSTLCLKTHTAKAAALPCLVFPAPHHLPVVSPNPPNQSLFSDNMYILAMKADFERGKS